MKLMFDPSVRSSILLLEQTFCVSQVSVSRAKCNLYSSKSVTRELIFSTIERAFVQARLSRSGLDSETRELAQELFVSLFSKSKLDRHKSFWLLLSILICSKDKSLILIKQLFSETFSNSFWLAVLSLA